jgi:hypothetical protein
MVDASLFIPLVIVALTQLIKMGVPQVQGWVTVILAFVVGLVIALIDVLIGLTDISIAQGLIYALGAIGISVVAGKAGGGASGDQTVVK